MAHNKDGISLNSSLRLSRCIVSKAWENSSHLLKQLEGIGSNYAKILADSGIQTFRDLKSCDRRRLEMVYISLFNIFTSVFPGFELNLQYLLGTASKSTLR